MPPLSQQLLQQQQQHQQFSAEKMARVASEDAREARLLFEGMGRAHLEHAVSSQLEIHHEIYNRRRDGHVPPSARTPGLGGPAGRRDERRGAAALGHGAWSGRAGRRRRV
tara:strand:- start:237 stop:566 length:330 start_codon:yes stop_codon:yes gene_type:complete